MRNIFLVVLICSSHLSYSQLVINEISQGTTGSEEYVEFLVYDASVTCPDECIDIRGWIIDDNNGWHASGIGTGIASGVMRFGDDPTWQCVKPGTIILIYNNSDINPLIPADDATDANNDCVLVLPGNSTLLDRNTSQPAPTGTSSYVGLPWGDAASWTSVNMQNDNDTYHIVDPANINTSHFAVSWGNNTLNNLIYFSGSAAGLVFEMTNSSDDNPFNTANWSSASASSNQTPGTPNNAANASWINSLNNNCMSLVTADAGMDVTYCEGDNTTTTLTATGGGSYEWSTTDMMASTTVMPASTTTYTVTVTDVSTCTSTDEVQVIVNISPIPAISQTGNLCGSSSVTLDAGIGYSNYNWSNSAMMQTTSVTIAGTYTVTVTDSNTCTGSNSSTVMGNTASPAFIR